MPLTTVQTVELDGGLVPTLFQPVGIMDQPSLDAMVLTKLLVADSWMKRHLKQNYATLLTGPTAADALVVQAQGQSLLTLHYILPILQACKVYGTNYPFMSEESPNYDALVLRSYYAEAMSLLDEWVTLENVGTQAFAMPTFGFSAPVPTVPCEGNGLVPRVIQYEEALEESAGIRNPPIGGVRR